MKVTTRREALLAVAEWVIGCDNKEYDDYVMYCDDNDLDPKNLQDEEQSNHPYALALIGLGLEFPTKE